MSFLKLSPGYWAQAARASHIEKGGDIQGPDLSLGGTRGRARPSVRDGRVTDFKHHYNRWLNEMQRYRDAAKAYKP